MQKLPWMAAAVIAALALPIAGEAAADARLKQAAQHFADLEDDKAKAILDQLSAEGVADADVLLGYLYSDPLYEGQDYEIAISYFERAAEQKHPEALFQLAESLFWPEYLDLEILSAGEATRPHHAFADYEQSYDLLQRTVAQEHPGAMVRLAIVCIFDGYPCTETEIEAALEPNILVLRNLGYVMGSFAVLRDSREGLQMEGLADRLATISLGYAALDPLVADMLSYGIWDPSDSSNRFQGCPEVNDVRALLRLMALKNSVATRLDNDHNFDSCFDAEERTAVERKLLGWVDAMVTEYDNWRTPHVRWCYENRSGYGINRCLVTSWRDHFFSCHRLSTPRFLKDFGIEYNETRRYQRCREHVLSVRQG